MNKLVNQKTYFPCWHAYDPTGKYVGRIQKDQYGVWNLYNDKGQRSIAESFAEARIEARDFLKSSNRA